MQIGSAEKRSLSIMNVVFSKIWNVYANQIKSYFSLSVSEGRTKPWGRIEFQSILNLILVCVNYFSTWLFLIYEFLSRPLIFHAICLIVRKCIFVCENLFESISFSPNRSVYLLFFSTYCIIVHYVFLWSYVLC